MTSSQNMGKDNHTKQSKGSNNSKVQPFLGQENKPNNYLLHNSVLQWVPEPRLFIHQDAVCMILIILSEMLLFLQYFMIFGTSFLNYNWRQFIVSAILLLLGQVNEIIPKEYFSHHEIDLLKPLNSAGLLSHKNIIHLCFLATLIVVSYESSMTMLKWLNLFLVVASTNGGVITESLFRRVEYGGLSTFPIFKKLKAEYACSFGIVYIIGNPLLTLFKYLYLIHIALYLSSANMLWIGQHSPTIIHFNALELCLSIYCTCTLLSPFIVLQFIERHKMNIYLVIERSIQRSVGFICQQERRNFSVCGFFEQNLFFPCMLLLKSVLVSKKSGLNIRKLSIFAAVWALVNIFLVVFVKVSQRFLISQAAFFLICLLILAVLLMIMSEVAEISKQLQPLQTSLSVNSTYDLKHGSAAWHEHQNVLTQIAEASTEQKLSTDAISDNQLKSIHQTMWLRLKSTSVFNHGGIQFTSNAVGTTTSAGKRLRRKSR